MNTISKFLWIFVLCSIQRALAFVATPAEAQSRTWSTELSLTTTLLAETESIMISPSPTELDFRTDQAFISAAITIAPFSLQSINKRQRCWNDQGFSVDCATWTGYYYTWGPPGNPYLGGPGEGGGGSGTEGGGNGNGGYTTIESSTAPDTLITVQILVGAIFLAIAFTL